MKLKKKIMVNIDHKDIITFSRINNTCSSVFWFELVLIGPWKMCEITQKVRLPSIFFCLLIKSISSVSSPWSILSLLMKTPSRSLSRPNCDSPLFFFFFFILFSFSESLFSWSISSSYVSLLLVFRQRVMYALFWLGKSGC